MGQLFIGNQSRDMAPIKQTAWNGDREQPVHSHHRGGHFALVVDSLDEWEKHLDKYGATRLPRKSRPDGALQTFVQDPDGHWVELCMLA